MKRSEINRIIRSADEFIRECHFYLPPFAYWSLDEWVQKVNVASEIAQQRLGWDITDFGQGSFAEFGLVLFTIRNGNPYQPKHGKPYCEKILITQPGQKTPMHFHWRKMEDIINRGGGELFLRLYNADENEELDFDKPVVVAMDGITHTLEAGGIVRLKPGESITLAPGMYHEFWGPEDRVLIGEVSLVNDDERDNRFAQTIGRFPEIQEDEPPLYLLCTDFERMGIGNRGLGDRSIG